MFSVRSHFHSPVQTTGLIDLIREFQNSVQLISIGLSEFWDCNLPFQSKACNTGRTDLILTGVTYHQAIVCPVQRILLCDVVLEIVALHSYQVMLGCEFNIVLGILQTILHKLQTGSGMLATIVLLHVSVIVTVFVSPVTAIPCRLFAPGC